jgi:hypothetical protein
MKINIYKYISLLAFLCLFSTCLDTQPEESLAHRNAKKVVAAWADFILILERRTTGYRPPVSARMFAYWGMTAYETAFPILNNPAHLNAIGILPPQYSCPKPPTDCDAALALNAAFAEFGRRFFYTAQPQTLVLLNELEQTTEKNLEQTSDKNTLEASKTYGKSVAEAIWRYSATDKAGHDAFLYNFDKQFTPPQYFGAWQPSAKHPMPALLPHWSEVRTFVSSKNTVALKPPLAFDTSSNSPFYKQAMEVYLDALHPTADDIWIAEFWSDDLEGLTVSPAGRWYSILNQYITQNNFALTDIIEAYLKLGIALNDAAVICWYGKYFYNVERPETYIQRHIDPQFEPLHHSPSFPSYPSGHSIFGAAAVEVFKKTLGNTAHFADKTHEGRTEFKGTARVFTSFDAMSTENAYSRILLGVHYRMDSNEGLRLGKIIGQKTTDLQLRRADVSIR